MDDDSLTRPLCAHPTKAAATSTIANKSKVNLLIDMDIINHHLMFVNRTAACVNPADKGAVTKTTSCQTLFILVCLFMHEFL